MKGLEITDHNKCVGCSICAFNCPVKCITMVYDEEGFKYPVVDEKTCIDCLKCQRSCPVNKPIFNDENYAQKSFLAISRDKAVYDKSSSGGIFYHLARKVIENGGVVYGAAFDEQYNLKHIGVESVSELFKLLGSKYIQSDLSGIWNDLKKNINLGREVLFSGTPCQIGALRSLFPDEKPNLKIVDVICMGVPSPMLFNQYKQDLTNRYSKIENIAFRNKYYFGNTRSQSMVIRFQQNKIYARTRTDDPFFLHFLKCNTLRLSCYDCAFKSIQRGSDITLGDCWGLHDLIKIGNGEKTVSLIICNTDHGFKMLTEIYDQIQTQEIPMDKVLNAQPMLSNSCNPGAIRNFILKDALKSKSVYKYLRKIGNITFKNDLKSWLTHVIYHDKI